MLVANRLSFLEKMRKGSFMVNYKNKLTFINNPVLLKAFKVP